MNKVCSGVKKKVTSFSYPCMRSGRAMPLAWHWIGVGYPWHRWGDDRARRLRVECDWRHYRHLLTS